MIKTHCQGDHAAKRHTKNMRRLNIQSIEYCDDISRYVIHTGLHAPRTRRFPDAAQVQVAAVTFAGKTSATVAPVTALGPAFDATIDSAIATFEPAARTALFRRAHALLVADAPAIWLYEPRNLAAVHARLVPVGVRPDAWLAQLGDWRADGTRTTALR